MDEDKPQNTKKNEMEIYLEIEALVDGELDTATAKALLAKINTDPSLELHYNKIKNQKSVLRKWWKKKQMN